MIVRAARSARGRRRTTSAASARSEPDGVKRRSHYPFIYLSLQAIDVDFFRISKLTLQVLEF